ncbi:ArsR family transcriptional regulator [Natrononativus amylolyticus]|uniref:ArsR family transcriptional regulator n=1 Tax=Natrononativus amylolyticus TaxID=2963434 RepID=UPI0020CB85EE|nr:ArsR family transcriptional regulator [Natrononativus amylolyticus]
MTPDPWKAMLSALMSKHRRRILVKLLEQESVMIPEEVADGEAEFQGLQTEMHHTHLPQLTDQGYVRKTTNFEVVRGPQFENIRPLLEVLQENHKRLPSGLA